MAKVISEEALVKRINRALRKRFLRLDGCNLVLKHTRGESAWLDLGDYYVLDVEKNFVVHHHVDIEVFAKELDVNVRLATLAEDLQLLQERCDKAICRRK